MPLTLMFPPISVIFMKQQPLIDISLLIANALAQQDGQLQLLDESRQVVMNSKEFYLW